MIAAARTVVAFGVVLQIAGFVKLVVIADYFGACAVLDAYYLGLVIPTFLAGVSAGILQTGLVPAYVSARARGDDAIARTLGNVTLTWTAVALGAIAGLLTALRIVAVPLLSHETSPDTRAALQSAFALLVWTTPLAGLADGGALLLNAEGRFGAAASAPLLNAAVGTIVLVACRGRGIDALVWSLLAGLAAQALVVLVAMRGAGISLRPQFTLPVALPRMLGTFALPVLLSMVLVNLVPAFVQAVSARAGPGAVSAMGYASRLHNSLVQAVVMSVSVVLLPHFSRLIAEGKNIELRATLERVFAATLLFAAAALVLVASGGPAVVQMLLERGHFTSADAQLVARVWFALTAGLLGVTWSIFLTRLFQAQQLVWVIFMLGCVSVLANVALAYALLPMWGVMGVALANSVSYTMIAWLAHRRFDRTLGRLLGVNARGFIARTILANLLAYAGAVWWGNALGSLGPFAVITGQFLIVAAANLLVASTPPLGVPVIALLRR
jgi:putative peptidoglycan lipid II flippase